MGARLPGAVPGAPAPIVHGAPIVEEDAGAAINGIFNVEWAGEGGEKESSCPWKNEN